MSNDRTGHNFVIPGKVNGQNEVYGMHISALRLPPHWYHGIALFQFTDSSCAETVKNAHARNPAIFISINYRVRALSIFQKAVPLFFMHEFANRRMK